MENEPTCNHCDCENCVQHVTLEEFLRTFGTVGVIRAGLDKPGTSTRYTGGSEETGYEEIFDIEDVD